MLQAIADPNCHLTWLNLKCDAYDRRITALTNALKSNSSLVMLNNLYSAPFADLNSPHIQGFNRTLTLFGKISPSILHEKSDLITHNYLYKSLTLKQLAWLKAVKTGQDLSLLPSHLSIPFTKWQTKAMKTLGLFSFDEYSTRKNNELSCLSMDSALRIDAEKPGPC